MTKTETETKVKYHWSIEQRSIEWYKLRLGRIGGTSSAVLLQENKINPDRDCCPMCNSVSVSYRKTKKDWRCTSCKSEFQQTIKYGESERYTAIPKGMMTLIYSLASDIITSEINDDSYVSPSMQRGLDLEPLAAKKYSKEYFCTVDECGYIEKGELLGVSPDRVIRNANAGIEIKCKSGTEFLRFRDTKKIEKEYICQCQWQMYITGWDYVDLVYFHPRFENELEVVRLTPDTNMFAEWDSILPSVIKKVKELVVNLR